MPSAPAPSALSTPSGASGRVAPVTSVLIPARIRLTPPASATSHSPVRRLCAARWSAASEDEQAVSTAMLGPVRPRVCETRLAMIDLALPSPR